MCHLIVFEQGTLKIRRNNSSIHSIETGLVAFAGILIHFKFEPTQTFRLKTTTSYLCYRTDDLKVLSRVWKLTSKHCFLGRDVNLCIQDVYISAKLSVVLKLFPISVGNTEFSGKEPEPSNKGLLE